MKTTINIETWHRKEYFEWFRQFDEPFWSLTADIEITSLYERAKKSNAPFSLYMQHTILQAINSVDEFKYRIEGQNVVFFERIHISPVVARDDHSYGCSFVEYTENIDDFVRNSLEAQEYVKSIKGLNITSDHIDTIHYSTHPWTQFTSLTRTRKFNNPDSCPKISTGKFYEKNGKLMIPICTAAHHGFVDGYHTGMLYKRIEEIAK